MYVLVVPRYYRTSAVVTDANLLEVYLVPLVLGTFVHQDDSVSLNGL